MKGLLPVGALRGFAGAFGVLAGTLGVCGGALDAQQQRTPLRPLPKELPEVVLSGATEGLPIAEFGLGSGGIGPRRGRLRFDGDDGCVTPGGVRVACRAVGVKLTFPSGRELLLAPDGGLHLRSGEAAGPFRAGLELLLADGCRVQVSLAQSRKNRVRDVRVTDGVRSLQPWRRGSSCRASGRAERWSGVRLACCGDGGELYRPLALGAMVVLDRVLVADARRDEAPRERLVVMTDPLRRSLARMPRQHRETKQTVRRAVAAVAAVADRGEAIFPAGAALRRAEHDRLRWLLEGGFELQLDLDGPLAPRLQLFAGASPLPMVEWTLGAAGAAYMTNPDGDQLGKRWHG
ncbi:MAG: hypothetical protein KAI24_02115, partial [Planctomycetes bacterium]|nr:hypothetical protein [Planctomycetota bacterium]